VKVLLVDAKGKFAPGLGDLCRVGDPQIISHPAVQLVSNTLWSGLVMTEFILTKAWFIFSLVILLLQQAILPMYFPDKRAYWATVVCRMITYLLTMLRLVIRHTREICLSYRNGSTSKLLRVIVIPSYLKDPYYLASFFLTIFLICMCAYEPLFWCWGDFYWPVEDCEGRRDTRFEYSVFGMISVLLHWGLMADLAVFFTGLSAFVLVCTQVGSEIGRFLFALAFLLTAFASAISVLEHDYEDMTEVTQTWVALFSITLRLYEDDYRDFQHDPVLLGAVFAFVSASAIVLLNLLIAQLNCSYVYIYANMVGYARLKRSTVVVAIMSKMNQEKYTRFLDTLGLDQPLEFNQGDVGMAGGMQVLELQSQTLVTQDRIKRFGGSCALDMQWPEEVGAETEEEQLAKLEQLMRSTLSKLSSDKKKRRGGSGNTGGSSADQSGASDLPSSASKGGMSRGVSGASGESDDSF